MGNITSLIIQLLWEMKTTTIWKLSLQPIESMWVLSGLTSVLVSLYYDSSTTTDLGGPLNHWHQLLCTKQVQVRISSQANKIPQNMKHSTKTPKWVLHRHSLGPSGLISSDTAWKQLHCKAGPGNSRDVLTWHSTWTNKLLVLNLL